MAHGAQVVDFIRLSFLDDANQITGVAQVPVMQFEAGIVQVRVLVNMVNPLRVEEAAAALDAVNHIALFEQKLGQVRTVLASDAGDECDFG